MWDLDEDADPVASAPGILPDAVQRAPIAAQWSLPRSNSEPPSGNMEAPFNAALRNRRISPGDGTQGHHGARPENWQL